MKFIKVMGVAMMASLAMMAFVASAVHADRAFTASSYPVNITGAQEAGNNHALAIEGLLITCTTAHFSAANVSGPQSTITVKSHYTGCNTFGVQAWTIDMGSCAYELKTPSGTSPNFTGNLAVRCTDATKPVILHMSSFLTECKLTIGEAGNTSLADVKYTNIAGGDVRVDANVSGITVNKTVDSGLCPLSGTGHTATGVYDGNTIVEGLLGVNIDIG